MIWLTLAFAVAFVGCAFLALSQPRNWRAVAGKGTVAPTRAYRRIGWTLVASALGLCWARDGLSFAALLWPLVLGAAAGAVAFMLSYCPARLRPFARLKG